MTTKSRLLALPDELLVAIADFVAVADLLNFALTCKTTLRCAKERLGKNAHFAPEWIVRHDRLPLTVPELIRLATQHVDQIWHIKSLDFWTARTKWDEWKTDEYDDQSGQEHSDWPDPAQDCTDLDSSYFTHEEVELYNSLLMKQLCFTEEEAALWSSRLQDGNDEPLKCLLMANSPRLDRVNFIALDMARDNDELDDHPLAVLKLACSRLRATSAITWPPGLQNLRQVSVCTGSGLRHPHDAYYMQPADVAPLFALPSLKVLNLQLLGYGDEDDFDLAPRSSTVEELAFACCEISFEGSEKFIRAATHLRRLGSDDANMSGGGGVLDLLADSQAESLEELVLRPSPSPDDFARLQNRFTKLTVLEGLDITSIDPRSGRSLGNVGSSTDLAQYLPSSIKKVRIFGESLALQTPGKSCADHLQAVADLVENEKFGGLTEVCIYDFFYEMQANGTVEELGNVSDWESAAYHRIRASGVDIHCFGLDGSPMGYEEHVVLHHDFSTGSLLPIETHPGPAPG